MEEDVLEGLKGKEEGIEGIDLEEEMRRCKREGEDEEERRRGEERNQRGGQES